MKTLLLALRDLVVDHAQAAGTRAVRELEVGIMNRLDSRIALLLDAVARIRDEREAQILFYGMFLEKEFGAPHIVRRFMHGGLVKGKVGERASFVFEPQRAVKNDMLIVVWGAKVECCTVGNNVQDPTFGGPVPILRTFEHIYPGSRLTLELQF